MSAFYQADPEVEWPDIVAALRADRILIQEITGCVKAEGRQATREELNQIFAAMERMEWIAERVVELREVTDDLKRIQERSKPQKHSLLDKAKAAEKRWRVRALKAIAEEKLKKLRDEGY